MNHIIKLFVVVTILFLTACKKETTSTNPVNEAPGSTAMAIDSGSFSNGPYGSVSGKAKIYKTGSKYELALESFSMQFCHGLRTPKSLRFAIPS